MTHPAPSFSQPYGPAGPMVDYRQIFYNAKTYDQTTPSAARALCPPTSYALYLPTELPVAVAALPNYPHSYSPSPPNQFPIPIPTVALCPIHGQQIGHFENTGFGHCPCLPNPFEHEPQSSRGGFEPRTALSVSSSGGFAEATRLVQQGFPSNTARFAQEGNPSNTTQSGPAAAAQAKPVAKAKAGPTDIFVHYGTEDPEKGKRRRDAKEDSLRKEAIARAGGVCLACRHIRKKCDGDQPCEKCSKKGLLSEEAIRAELLTSFCSDGHDTCFFAENPSMFVQWLDQFQPAIIRLESHQSVSVEISLDGDSLALPFTLSANELKRYFPNPTLDPPDVGHTAGKLTAAFLPKGKSDKMNALEQSKASAVTREILKIFLAILNFLRSEVSVSIDDKPLAQSFCAFSLVRMLILFNEKVCMFEREIAVLDHIDKFCYRKWEENLESINMLTTVMRGFQNLPHEEGLGALLDPLRGRADTFRRYLVQRAKAFQKGTRRQSRSEPDEMVEPAEALGDFPEIPRAMVAIFKIDASIPGKASRGFAPHEETPMPISYLLKTRGSISDYLGQVVRGDEKPLPTLSTHTSWPSSSSNEDLSGLIHGQTSLEQLSAATPMPPLLEEGEGPEIAPVDFYDDPCLEFLDFEGGSQMAEQTSEHWTDENTQVDGATTIQGDQASVIWADHNHSFRLDQHLVAEPTEIEGSASAALDNDLAGVAIKSDYHGPPDMHGSQPQHSQFESPTRSELLASPTKQVHFQDKSEEFEIQHLNKEDVPNFRCADGTSGFALVSKRRQRSWTPSSRSRERKRIQLLPLRSSNPYDALRREQPAT